MSERPQVTREYNGAMLDSTYWNQFDPRSDDIVISTSMKAGTTWVQRICAALVFQTAELKEPVDVTSPWLDMRNSLPGFVQPALEAQTHRRFIKSHLPLDATPYFDEVKYIVVGRDARDVFMSMVPHHYNVSANTVALMNTRNGEEFVAKSRELGIEVSPEQAEIIASQRRQWHGEEPAGRTLATTHELSWSLPRANSVPSSCVVASVRPAGSSPWATIGFSVRITDPSRKRSTFIRP